MFGKSFVLVGIAALSIFANSIMAVCNVKDPSGKTVLVVDHDVVKDAAGDKTLMTITDDKITDANGNLVLYINGDMIRDKPEGNLLMMIDGRHIKRGPGGDNLLYVDGKNLMRGDRSGAPLYKFSGDDLTSQREMAVLYLLMPELFGATKEQDAKILAAQSQTAAAGDADAIKNFVAGEYKIDTYASQGDSSPNKAGTVTITKVGDLFVMDFKYTQGDPAQGVAMQHGDELWAAVGPAATVGLAAYKVDGGKLSGIWYNATGKPESFGSENATGAEALGGDYKITDAKAPFTQAAYVGTLSLTSANKKFWNTAPIYKATWDLGGGYKATGIGFNEKDSLAIATSTTGDCSIAHFKINLKDNCLNGQFYTAKDVIGIYSLKKVK
jgi:hypothetical protein